MQNELSKEQIDAIIQAFNEMIEQGPWDKSHFLKVIGKNLSVIRDDFVHYVNSVGVDVSLHKTLLHNKIERDGLQQQVFIALYASDGASIASWERLLLNLPKQVLSRPIYAKEEDIQSIIKTKENRINEAYVAVFINPSDIIPLGHDKAPIDKLGTSLLTLKDKSIHIDNIEKFVHLSGTYHYLKGQLVKA